MAINLEVYKEIKSLVELLQYEEWKIAQWEKVYNTRGCNHELKIAGAKIDDKIVDLVINLAVAQARMNITELSQKLDKLKGDL